MKIIYFLIIILLITSCSKTENRSVAQGGQDSGGANTILSTNEEVEAAYKNALNDLPEAVTAIMDRWFIYYVYDAEKKYLLQLLKNKLIEFIPESERSKIDLIEDAYSKQIELDKNSKIHPIIPAFKKIIEASSINIKTDSPCSSLDKPHGFASIKDFQLGSPICISFFKFRTLPADVLYKEILAVLLHEYLHALGFEERQALMIQSVFANNFQAASREYYQKTKEYMPEDDLNGLLQGSLLALRNLVSKLGKLKESDRRRFCYQLNYAHYTSIFLYQNYAKILKEKKERLIQNKLLDEDLYSTLEMDLEAMRQSSILSPDDVIVKVFERCNGKAEIVVDYELQNTVITSYIYMHRGIDAINEITEYKLMSF